MLRFLKLNPMITLEDAFVQWVEGGRRSYFGMYIKELEHEGYAII